MKLMWSSKEPVISIHKIVFRKKTENNLRPSDFFFDRTSNGQ